MEAAKKSFFFNGSAIKDGGGVKAVPLRNKNFSFSTAEIRLPLSLREGAFLRKKYLP